MTNRAQYIHVLMTEVEDGSERPSFLRRHGSTIAMGAAGVASGVLAYHALKHGFGDGANTHHDYHPTPKAPVTLDHTHATGTSRPSSIPSPDEMSPGPKPAARPSMVPTGDERTGGGKTAAVTPAPTKVPTVASYPRPGESGIKRLETPVPSVEHPSHPQGVSRAAALTAKASTPGTPWHPDQYKRSGVVNQAGPASYTPSRRGSSTVNIGDVHMNPGEAKQHFAQSQFKAEFGKPSAAPLVKPAPNPFAKYNIR